jgi:hypothetical protein
VEEIIPVIKAAFHEVLPMMNDGLTIEQFEEIVRK